ncbi:MAG TPA: hypothetical protein VIM71_11475 [Lacunisphaera sp.]
MNASITSGAQEAAHLEKLRTQISTDIETMHQKEASLREYEQRLRALVDHVQHTTPPQGATPQPAPLTGPSQAELDSQWEKYERAHALLEAARRGLSDDRMALKDREEKIMIREQEVARREAWLKVREEEFAAKLTGQTPPPAKPKPAFTAAPIRVAKNLLHLGKAS